MNLDEWAKNKIYVYYNERFKTLWECRRAEKYDHLNMLLFIRVDKLKLKFSLVNIDYIESLHYVEIGEL